jgi:hypothetical protein
MVQPDAVIAGAIGWATSLGVLVLAAMTAGFHTAAVADRLLGRRHWPLRLTLGAFAVLICAVLTPLAYMPIGDFGAAFGEPLARALGDGGGLLGGALLDLFASLAAGFFAYAAALALVVIPTAPALYAWRVLVRPARAPAPSRVRPAR